MPSANGQLHSRMVPDFPLVAAGLAAREASRDSVASRLEKRFGLGDDASKRRALYRQIQRLHDRWPLEIEDLIRQAIKIAVDGEDEGRLFCAMISRFMKASGLTGTRRKGRSLEW